MKLVKVEMFIKIDETLEGADLDWIAMSVNQQLQGNELLMSFHVEDADPNDIGLDSL